MLAQAGATDAMQPCSPIWLVPNAGDIKQGVYESGMPAVTDARRRFNVRFYIVAMLFLLFDVEVVILWPWALAYYESATGAGRPSPLACWARVSCSAGAGSSSFSCWSATSTNGARGCFGGIEA
jgi:hypothetical protein